MVCNVHFNCVKCLFLHKCNIRVFINTTRMPTSCRHNYDKKSYASNYRPLLSSMFSKVSVDLNDAQEL